MTRRTSWAFCLLVSVACRGGGTAPERAPAPAAPVRRPSPSAGTNLGAHIFTDSVAPERTGLPVLPPRFARDAGYMPLASAGVSAFRARYPTYDGRGVLIGVLDSGIDPSAPGLERTSAGTPKVIDLRDFSGQGKVPLAILPAPVGGSLTVAGCTEAGAGRIARLAANGKWYGGELRIGDEHVPGVVVRASDGWVVFLDANLNGSFEDDKPLHDYRDGGETVAVGAKRIVVAANFTDQGGVPALDLVFDDAGHGTHVAGVAAGHELFHLTGFDGVAPGAQVIGLKVTDNQRGGVSATGSIVEALNYAAKFAADRGLPLVLSLSFAVRMPIPGSSAIDSLVDAFLIAHPDVVLTVAAGNEGPGLATIGSPAAADLALAVGSSLPLAFAKPPNDSGPSTSAGDVMGWWSARGGLTAKPDLIVPGLAFSTVPAFAAGLELERGTSVGAPYAAGMAACLLSALAAEDRRVSAIEIVAALRASATALPGTSFLDRGAGVPRLEAAYRWLAAGHQGSDYAVRASDGNTAALDYASPSTDSVLLFRVRHLAGRRAAEFVLRSTVPWLSGPAYLSASPVETAIPVHIALPPNLSPGVYTGSLVGRTPSDSAAGPLFTIVSTIVVPYDLAAGEPLVDPSRAIPAGRVQRYFLRVPGRGVTFAAQVTITGGGADTLARQVAMRLYEPGGRPVSGQAMQEHGPGARYVVPSDEAKQGVYELDVAAPPLAGITVSVRAEASRFRMDSRGSEVEAANTGANSITGSLDQSLVGVAKNVVVNGSGAAPETLVVRAPVWATMATVRTEVRDSTWRELTGFAVSTLDSGANRIAAFALHNAQGTQSITIPPSVVGHALLLELYPAFARSDAARSWQTRVQITFMLPEPRALGSVRPLSLVAGERVDVPLVKPEPDEALVVPPGFVPYIEARVRPAPTGNSGTETAVLHVAVGAAP